MSHTPAAGASEARLYTRFFEYARVITKVVVTDEGVYQKGEVPDTYGGSQLELEVVNAVIMCNSRYELQVLEFAADEIMDKTKKKGGPITRDGEDYLPATGDSSTPVAQETKLNAGLTAALKTIGQKALGALNADAERYGRLRT